MSSASRLGTAVVPGEFPFNTKTNVCENDEDFEKISSKFGWDHKSIIWEILNMSVAVGRPDAVGVNVNNNLDASDPQEYAAMLDIDYMTSLSFQAGVHEQNKSTWSLSFYKTSPDYLGLFMHLLELAGDDGSESTGVNRRAHHNHSFDDYDRGQGLYFKYRLCVLNSDGDVVHNIDNGSIINISPGQSWGEEDFIPIRNLWDPTTKLLDSDQEKLVIRVDLWLFSQLNHYKPEVFLVELQPPRKQSSFTPLEAKPTGTTRKDVSLSGEKSPILDALWMHREFADVQIHCGGRSFAVHKCIISAASPVFKAMFSTSMTEASENRVDICDLDGTVLEALLSFMYNQSLPSWWDWSNLEISAQLVNAAEKYEVKELKGVCFAALCEKLDHTNAGGLAVLSHVYEAENCVKEFVARCIIRNIKRLKLDPGFVDLVFKHPPVFAGILLSDALSKSVSSSSCL